MHMSFQVNRGMTDWDYGALGPTEQDGGTVWTQVKQVLLGP
jgi:hypothetical protein